MQQIESDVFLSIETHTHVLFLYLLLLLFIFFFFLYEKTRIYSIARGLRSLTSSYTHIFFLLHIHTFSYVNKCRDREVVDPLKVLKILSHVKYNIKNSDFHVIHHQINYFIDRLHTSNTQKICNLNLNKKKA